MRDLRRAFQIDVTLIGREDVSRQPFDQPAVLVAANGRAERRRGERRRQLRSQHIRRVHPAVLVVRNGDGLSLRAQGHLFEVELVDGLGVLAVRQARQRARHRQHDEPGVFAVAERHPLRVLRGSNDRLQIARLGQFLPAAEAEQRGDAADRNGQNAAAATPDTFSSKRDIVGMVLELVVADEGGVWSSTRRSELALVNLLEEAALIELGGLLEVLEELSLGAIQHPQLERLAGFALADQVMQAAPGPLELEELGLVHDRRELLGDHRVDALRLQP